ITRIVALGLILILAVMQLFNFTPKFVGTRIGLYGTGLIAGIVSGLAALGGMVVALYVLASKIDPRSMRGALVMYLFIGLFTSLIWHLIYGLLICREVPEG
ncbi:MAG: sulfite exporter TauE/SafE family protein, partial [Rhodobacterales bacterium]